MDFLDHSTVIAILIGLAFGSLVSWLAQPILGPLFPMFQSQPSEARLRELDALIESLSRTELNQVNESLMNKRKIEAIKHFRFATNAGLSEAKEAVELMQQKLPRSA